MVEKPDEVNGFIINFDPNAIGAELYSVILLFAFQLFKVGNFLDGFCLLHQSNDICNPVFQTLVFYLVSILGKASVDPYDHERSFFGKSLLTNSPVLPASMA